MLVKRNWGSRQIPKKKRKKNPKFLFPKIHKPNERERVVGVPKHQQQQKHVYNIHSSCVCGFVETKMLNVKNKKLKNKNHK